MTTSCKHCEDELIRMAQQGNPCAMEEILIRHQPLIKMLASRFSYINTAQQDLVQAGCLGMIHAVHRFDTGRQVFLRTYAVPWILGEMKKEARHSVYREISIDDHYADDSPALVDRLVDQAGIDPEMIDLHFALQQLSPDERIVIVLRYTRDKTQQETACLLKKSQAQISKTEKKAIDHLRRLMS